MVYIEWLVEVNRKLLPFVFPRIKELNGGYIKIIKEGENSITIAIGKNPEEINLEKVQRIKAIDNPSCWERWEPERSD